MEKKEQVGRDRKEEGRREEERKDERKGRREGEMEGRKGGVSCQQRLRQLAVPCSLQMRRLSPSVTVRESLVHMRQERVTKVLVCQMPTRLLSQMSGLHNGIANKQ